MHVNACAALVEKKKIKRMMTFNATVFVLGLMKEIAKRFKFIDCDSNKAF